MITRLKRAVAALTLDKLILPEEGGQFLVNALVSCMRRFLYRQLLRSVNQDTDTKCLSQYCSHLVTILVTITNAPRSYAVAKQLATP